MKDDDRDELISAALDGEAVDVAALGTALDTPDGQRTLAAFVLLRAAVAADRPPLEDVRAAVTPARSGVGVRRRSLRLGLAASAAACALAGSFWLGTTRAPAARETTPTAVAAAPPNAEEPPPTPTRRLEYVPGVDWETGS